MDAAAMCVVRFLGDVALRLRDFNVAEVMLVGRR